MPIDRPLLGQKGDIEPRDGRDFDKIALNDTVVKANGERFWLYTAIVTETIIILHGRLYPSRTTVLTKLILRELREKHTTADAEYFADGTPWLQAGLFELSMHYRHETFGERNPIERVFQAITPRTEQFYNNFSFADPDTAESWLLAIAWAWESAYLNKPKS